MFPLCLLPRSCTAMAFTEGFFFYCLFIFLFPLWYCYIHSRFVVSLFFVWDLYKSSVWDFSFKYCIPNCYRIPLRHGKEHRKLKYLPMGDWIFSGIWYLLSVIFIQAREMETHTLSRSSQVTANLLLPVFASWINLSLTFMCSKKSLDSSHSHFFLQGYPSIYLQT